MQCPTAGRAGSKEGHTARRPGMWKLAEKQMYRQSRVELGKNSWKLKARRPQVSNLAERIRSLASKWQEQMIQLEPRKEYKKIR